MNKTKFKIYTLGCKVNQYDSKNLSKKLIEANFSLTTKNADLAIINSCAVTKSAIRKGRSMINKAKTENPNAKILLMGCWAKTYEEEINKNKIDLFWKVGNLDKLARYIQSHFKQKLINLDSKKSIMPIINNNKSRYFLKIQDGCDQFCSYCIIPYARGRLKSRPKTEIIKEIKEVCDNNYSEIVLCGIHLGLYGQEKNYPEKNTNLCTLLKEILKIKNLGRLRLSSIEVTEVTDELINLIKDNQKICKHLHISLQSGDNKVLKDMNRPYTRENFLNTVQKIKKEMPNFAISTDIIVGFPGETEEEFNNTYNLCKTIKFSKTHIFPFSAHEKTKAAAMEPKINPKTIKQRVEKLRSLTEEHEHNFAKNFTNKDLKVLIEHIEKDKIKCKTEYYFDIYINREKLPKNLQKTPNNNLIGKIIKLKQKN